jgi:outer membrane protein OmpA-like peptidoglycan-associated protein
VQRSNALRSLRGWVPAFAKLLLSLGIVLGSSQPARAQSGYFYLDRAQISGAPDDGFMVFRPYVANSMRVYGGLALGYAHNTLRAESVTQEGVLQNQVENLVQGQLITYANAGLQLMSRVGVSASLPISLYQITGRDPQAQGVGTGGLGDSKTAAHDLRLDLRVRSFETDDGGMRLGGGFALWLPTGNSTAFTGDGQMSGWIFGSAEFNVQGLLLAGHIGPHFRPGRSIGGENGALYLGSELRWAFGAYVPMREGKLRIGGELFGTTGLDPNAGPGVNTIFSARNTAFEWMGQARFLLDVDPSVYINAGAGTRLTIGYGAPDFRVLVSIGKYVELLEKPVKDPHKKVRVGPMPETRDLDTDGDGYPDAIDHCPTEKEDGKPPEPSDGCPTTDRDNDGILDAQDSCPDEPEDKDGIEDDDGCPETDADNDQVPDAEDKCPIEPGPRNDNPEKNGCPSLTRVTETGEVELLQPIEFEVGKAVIKPASYPILDEVVTLMKARGELRIGVYGHTDDRGSIALNTRLSTERAAACMNYLVDKGVSPGRLESKGFGPSEPIADNKTPEGRARNRRVEFKFLDQPGASGDKSDASSKEKPAE